MTDATRRTRLEWEFDRKAEGWFVTTGPFRLAAWSALGHGCKWTIRVPIDRGSNLVAEGEMLLTELDAMLDAEEWLAEAVREPGLKLGIFARTDP